MARSGRYLSYVLSLLYVLGSAATAPAAQVYADLHASWVAGGDFASGSEVRVVLRDKLGALKGVATESIVGGNWWLSFGPSPAPVTVGAGDSLEVLVDGTTIGTMGIPGITADTDPGTDITRGRIVAVSGAALPAQIELDLHLAHLVATPTPALEEVWTDVMVPVAADGRFSKAWNTGPEPRNLLRNDEITVRLHLTGPGGHVWNFSLPAPIAGMSVYEGINAVRVQGVVTSVHTLDLRTAGGVLRARTGLTLLDPGAGMAYFTTRGTPVSISPGLVVKINCSGPHSVRVPNLAGVVDATADQVSGTTLPSAVVEGSLTHDEYDSPTRAYAVSDAHGAFMITFPEDVVPGDLVELRIQMPNGTWIVRRLPVAP